MWCMVLAYRMEDVEDVGTCRKLEIRTQYINTPYSMYVCVCVCVCVCLSMCVHISAFI